VEEQGRSLPIKRKYAKSDACVFVLRPEGVDPPRKRIE
jgi:hypothetical protein